jgi:hypothetical protein
MIAETLKVTPRAALRIVEELGCAYDGQGEVSGVGNYVGPASIVKEDLSYGRQIQTRLSVRPRQCSHSKDFASRNTQSKLT